MTKDNLTELHGMFCDTIQEKSIQERVNLRQYVIAKG